MDYINFYQDYLRHFDGFHKDKAIIFEPWQYFTFGSPYAWIQTERLMGQPIRRFNESIVIIPKKQGKSIIKAGEKLYMMLMDNYPAAQVYILAVNSSHAQTLAYRDATLLVKNSPVLREMWESKDLRMKEGAAYMGIYYKDRFIRPLTTDARKADGPKIHMALLEEIKDWTDFDVYDTIKNGTASDPNAMVSCITTAGVDFSSLGYEREDYGKRLLNREFEDDRTFAVIYTIDKEDRDHWDNLEVVKKANPNFGVSVFPDYYKQKIQKAKGSERLKNDFMTKHLGVWINAYDAYFTMEKWMAIGRNEEFRELSLSDFEGKPCYIFVDLASKKDIAPIQFLFRYGKNGQGKDRYVTFGQYFLPAQVVSEDLVGHRADYNAWAERGLFTLTPGNVIDYDAILLYLDECLKKFKVMQVGFDEWGEEQFAQSLTKAGRRVKVGVVPQRTKYLSEPMKAVETYIVNTNENKEHDPRIIHNGDPVLSWAMGNVVAKEDANENVFPRKEHFNKKIDPAVALINLFYMNTQKPLPRDFSRRKPIIMKV